MTRTPWLLAASTLSALSLTACKRNEGGPSGDGGVAETSIESTLISEDEGALFSSVLDGVPLSLLPATPEQVADYIAGQLPQQYPGCTTVTPAGATVTVVFDGCTGPYGLVIVDGTVVFTVHLPQGSSIAVDATATDFIIGGASLDLDATAVYSVSGATQSLAITSRTTGTGALGNEIAHTGDYTVSWDATCASIDGAWTTSVGEAARSTTASVERCAASCPTGTITRDRFDAGTITVTFDGTRTARWTTSGGRSGTVQMLCGDLR